MKIELKNIKHSPSLSQEQRLLRRTCTSMGSWWAIPAIQAMVNLPIIVPQMRKGKD